MNEITTYLLRDLWVTCKGDLAKLETLGRVEQAFSVWALASREPHLLEADRLFAEAVGEDGCARSYQNVAVLGYLAGEQSLSSRLLPALVDGLDWLIGRPAFSPLRTPTFEVDGLGLLGIALGIRHLNGDTRERASAWLRAFLPQSFSNARVDNWNKTLMAAASTLVGCVNDVPVDCDCAELRVALGALGFELRPSDPTFDALQFLQRASPHSAADDDATPLRSVVRLVAIRWVMQSADHINLNKLTAQDVQGVLESLPHAFKRWTWELSSRTGAKGGPAIQWEILNEYHVQNLLWFVLAPLFPDLEDEENLPSLGHKHPRCDLSIPSLRLIIEVKFVRRNSQAEFAAVIDQIAADSNLYLSTNSGYDSIIAFIWDNSRATEQHEELRQALRRIPGVKGVCVHPRPARMEI